MAFKLPTIISCSLHCLQFLWGIVLPGSAARPLPVINVDKYRLIPGFIEQLPYESLPMFPAPYITANMSVISILSLSILIFSFLDLSFFVVFYKAECFSL